MTFESFARRKNLLEVEVVLGLGDDDGIIGSWVEEGRAREVEVNCGKFSQQVIEYDLGITYCCLYEESRRFLARLGDRAIGARPEQLRLCPSYRSWGKDQSI